MGLPQALAEVLELPVIVAPMTGVSGPELVVAAGRSGVIGWFPVHNAPTAEDLDAWLGRIGEAVRAPGALAKFAPYAPNLIVHRSNARLAAEVEGLIRHQVHLVITSVGSPAPGLEPLHSVGCVVLAAVASLRHVDRALEAGADGIVLLTAGAGGQTGSANPFAFVRAARERFGGPTVVAGGVSDGAGMLAAEVLGADLCYMGTPFIAAEESRADEAYRQAVVDASLDDVVMTAIPSGLPANFLREWWEAQPEAATERAQQFPSGFSLCRPLGGRVAWGAGHSVSGCARSVHSGRTRRHTQRTV
jgi:nitronate monooxygenase